MNTEEDGVIPAGLVKCLREAQRVVVLSGAGVSAESGVPTFREAQTGLWAHYDPEELATPQAFKREPELVWQWYTWRRALISKTVPNPGHFALVELERLVPEFVLITQNVDGLHAAAGSQNILELHGNIRRVRCFDEDIPVPDWQDAGDVLPKCPYCGGLLRPDVVWFGEMLPGDVLQAAWKAAGECDVFFSIGTSALVQPAASLPLAAIEHGATIVEVNPQDTPLSPLVTYQLKGPAGRLLPLLVERVKRGNEGR